MMACDLGLVGLSPRKYIVFLSLVCNFPVAWAHAFLIRSRFAHLTRAFTLFPSYLMHRGVGKRT